jgi:hypothetical protein
MARATTAVLLAVAVALGGCAGGRVAVRPPADFDFTPDGGARLDAPPSPDRDWADDPPAARYGSVVLLMLGTIAAGALVGAAAVKGLPGR